MKSKSIWKARSPCGISDVVSPRAVTYSGTFHQWFIIGVDAMRTLPTICVHSCSVSRVAPHSATGSAGHAADPLTSRSPRPAPGLRQVVHGSMLPCSGRGAAPSAGAIRPRRGLAPRSPAPYSRREHVPGPPGMHDRTPMTNPDPAGPPLAAGDRSGTDRAAEGTPFGLVIAGVAVFAVVVVLAAAGRPRRPLHAVQGDHPRRRGGHHRVPAGLLDRHLLVTQRLLGLGAGDGKTAADTYIVAIQLGAILAVVALYRRRLVQPLAGLIGRTRAGRRLLIRSSLRSCRRPSSGSSLGDLDQGPPLRAVAGGRRLGRRRRVPACGGSPDVGNTGYALTARRRLIIGLAQSLALWPGVSRSLVTIVAALPSAAMASRRGVQLPARPGTLGAATVHDLAKDGRRLVDDYGWRTPLLGALVAFVTGVVAVRWLVSTCGRDRLPIFGWYRIGIAAVTVVLLAVGVPSDRRTVPRLARRLHTGTTAFDRRHHGQAQLHGDHVPRRLHRGRGAAGSTGPMPDPEVHQFVNDLERPSAPTSTAGACTRRWPCGRRSAPSPDATPMRSDYAEVWRELDKVVYSTHARRRGDARTRLEREFDPEAVRSLRTGPTAT